MTHDQREIRRKKRVLEYAERIGNINKACRYFGVARSSFYEWRDRYRELGDEGLKSRRCCPHKHPNKTPDEVVEKILQLRRSSSSCWAAVRDDLPLKPTAYCTQT